MIVAKLAWSARVIKASYCHLCLTLSTGHCILREIQRDIKAFSHVSSMNMFAEPSLMFKVECKQQYIVRGWSSACSAHHAGLINKQQQLGSISSQVWMAESPTWLQDIHFKNSGLAHWYWLLSRRNLELRLHKQHLYSEWAKISFGGYVHKMRLAILLIVFTSRELMLFW